jgi:hypothetical protein
MLELNLKNSATAQSTLSFNSMCRMRDGTLLGASNTGLSRICGYADNGATIPALLKSGLLDLGSHHVKRFRFFYFGLETTGDLKLSVFCDGVLAGEYSVIPSDGGVRTIRVPISRIHQGRYWQWQLENLNGSFFSLYSVKALPIQLSGRQI